MCDIIIYKNGLPALSFAKLEKKGSGSKNRYSVDSIDWALNTTWSDGVHLLRENHVVKFCFMQFAYVGNSSTNESAYLSSSYIILLRGLANLYV